MIFPSDLLINSSVANYKVSFVSDDDFFNSSKVVDIYLVDSFFQKRLDFPSNIPVVWIEATETSKSLPSTIDVFIALKEAGLGRDSHLVAIGGGVIQDIATFVASVYMRGISWSYLPTTFLGMADSCLGGKSSINVGKYKNLLGNFHPPVRIEIIPKFIHSLPKVELVCGMAEAAKIAFCRGKDSFLEYEKLATSILNSPFDENKYCELLYMILSFKKWFIEKDEFDQSERRLLNFGHTFGHALESATAFAIPHGLAVAIGMMTAIRFTGEKRMFDKLWRHCLELLITVLDIEILDNFDTQCFLSAFIADKKHSSNDYHLILPTHPKVDKLGVEEVKLPSSNACLEKIQIAMLDTLSILKEEVLIQVSKNTSLQ